jgi:hypothetical protein
MDRPDLGGSCGLGDRLGRRSRSSAATSFLMRQAHRSAGGSSRRRSRKPWVAGFPSGDSRGVACHRHRTALRGSAPTSPSADTRPWSTARLASAGPPGPPIRRRHAASAGRRRRREGISRPPGSPGRHHAGPQRSGRCAPGWPPGIALQRWWQAWSKAPPPWQLQA